MRTNKKIFLIVRFANKQSVIIIMAQAKINIENGMILVAFHI